MIRFALLLALASILVANLNGQGVPAPASNTQQLFAEENWPAVIDAIEAAPTRSADQYYLYGTALAKLGRLEEARKSFLRGYQLQPRDQRFAIEMGGVDFLMKRYASATHWLLIASRISPDDAYVNDFCGSLFYLQGNLDAALKYWNRVAKPQIENVRSDPASKANPILLDRAFAFTPAATLQLPELETTEVRLEGMDIFPNHAITLAARPDERFDLTLHAQERNGFGDSTLAALVSTFRGAFYQTITLEYYNMGGSATNAQSLLRWDAQKRRALFALSGPLHRNARWRYRLAADLRNENWGIRNSFTGSAPTLASLNLRKEAASASVTSLNSGRWSWSAAIELSHRDLRNVNPGTTLPTDLLLQGYQLKQLTQAKYQLLYIPEKRFTITANASAETGRMWSQSGGLFFKPQASVVTHWLPRAQGDDLEMHQQFRAGNALGSIPFDELFMLGLERDNDLPMRAHIGTRDGRKGSAPLRRKYFLSNWEMDKNLYSNGLIAIKLGPFLDIGRITNHTNPLGSQQWLWDTGIQAKLSVLGVRFALTYGRDLRGGKNAFYARAIAR